MELKINDSLSTTNKYSYDALKEASKAGRIQYAYKTSSKIDESTTWELPNLTSLFYDLDTISLCLNLTVVKIYLNRKGKYRVELIVNNFAK